MAMRRRLQSEISSVASRSRVLSVEYEQLCLIQKKWQFERSCHAEDVDMEKFDFHPQEMAFLAGANRRYIGHLPTHLAQADRPKDVARIVMFQLEERNGDTLQFKGGDRYATPYPSKVLKNPNTGAEICFVVYEGARIMLEATNYIMGGKRMSDKELDTPCTQDGRTLRQVIADDVAKNE